MSEDTRLNESQSKIQELGKKIRCLKKEKKSLKLSLHSQNGGVLHWCCHCGKNFMTSNELIDHKRDEHEKKEIFTALAMK